MPNNSHISGLYQRYVDGNISESELSELFTLSTDPEHEAEFLELMDGSWASLRQTTEYLESLNTVPVRKIPVWKRYRWAAAAAIFLLLGTAVYYLASKPTATIPELVTKPATGNDINPGTEGAVLTLADGRKIVLDSAATGVLASEGNTKLVKLSNGEMAYEPGEKTSVILYNTLSTPRGRQFSVQLPDGSKVWLNAASSITYPTTFDGKERNVSITGEAYFEVTRDKSKPFHVTVNGMEVAVLGTHLDINSYSDENAILTTLLGGSVKVNFQKESVVIAPGQQSVLTNTIAVRNVNTNDVIAWKEGFFSYRHTDIKGIMRQLARWYDVEVVYEGTAPELSFTGKIDRSLKLSEVLRVLEQTKVNFRIEDGRKIIIKP